jgi:hypothetical protein
MEVVSHNEMSIRKLISAMLVEAFLLVPTGGTVLAASYAFSYSLSTGIEVWSVWVIYALFSG